MEHEDGLTRREAETPAAKDRGIRDADDHRAWLADDMVAGRAPR